MRTLYETLGVDRHASFSDIERSYRHSLHEYIVGSCNCRLREKDQLDLERMRRAYRVLSSPSRRLEYDLELELREKARLHMRERAGTAIGMILLIVGLTLIGRGYYRLQEAIPAISAASARQPDTMRMSMAQSPALSQDGERPPEPK